MISFRGTDNLSLSLNSGSDIYNGWVQGGGYLSTQSVDAENFYQAVTGTSVLQARQGTTLLVGHSLGGGLAGYIASLTGNQAYVFDNMPYAQSAVNRAILANLGLGYYSMAGYLTGLTSSAPVPLPNASGVTSIYTSGEILSPVRAIAPGLSAPLVKAYMAATFLGTGQFSIASAALDANLAISAGGSVAGEENDLPALSAYAGNTLFGLATPGTAIQLHSIALLVLLQYAQDNSLTDWQAIGGNLFQAYHDDDIGNANSLSNPGGGYGPSDQTMAEIAYSAVIRAPCRSAIPASRRCSMTPTNWRSSTRTRRPPMSAPPTSRTIWPTSWCNTPDGWRRTRIPTAATPPASSPSTAASCTST